MTSSPHFPQSNGFMEWQVKTQKNTLSTTQDASKSLENLLLDLWSTPISPRMPSPSEILQNRTIQCPSKPFTPVNTEHIWNYLLAKKKSQKQYFNRAQNTKEMKQLDPGQEVLFLSPAEHTYIPSTIAGKASTPQSYHIEAQGK